ncbi:MAG: UDP-N-acetylglucosamine--N-acetylmuramyl-(pentapeptide) pyrophosphoryl-undecaprenol N-acetylglucosamine transferase [Candidatus Cryosericum sp.]|nr:UDP-N-acetylglucosamine--N-acetylmuramyl-(pentapeptide) pyrophosphoryl-undecaprenol N-acetylglucosamine transferase [bacterium]
MKYVIAGGGTGGHIYPAVAIAERLLTSGSVTMLARSESMEERVFLAYGLAVSTVSSAPFLYSPRSIWRLTRSTASGVRAAHRIMSTSHVDAFIGTGGYVSVPGILAALMTGVPIYLLEQNTVMGRANRLFAHAAKRIFLGFPVENRSGARYILTGNPLRRRLYAALTACRTNSSQRTGLLFLGGSGGALFINNLFLRTVHELDERGRSLHVTAVTGTDDYARIRDEVSGMKLRHIVPSIVPYSEQMEDIYCNARVAVTRGGALALTELAVGGIYAVIIPYPFAVGHHQSTNAAYLQSQHLGVEIEQDVLDFNAYLSILEKALAEERSGQLPPESIFATDAGDSIAKTIQQECLHG